MMMKDGELEGGWMIGESPLPSAVQATFVERRRTSCCGGGDSRSAAAVQQQSSRRPVLQRRRGGGLISTSGCNDGVACSSSVHQRRLRGATDSWRPDVVAPRLALTWSASATSHHHRVSRHWES
ncbi:hypothetical protein B566_EDAN006649 [Ephemera danica]|nr:hypothetical protein B566_EDAN006649 [Ephemera danica]